MKLTLFTLLLSVWNKLRFIVQAVLSFLNDLNLVEFTLWLRQCRHYCGPDDMDEFLIAEDVDIFVNEPVLL